MTNAQMLAAVTDHLDRIREIGRRIGLPDDMTDRWDWEAAQCPLGFVKMELEQRVEKDRTLMRLARTGRKCSVAAVDDQDVVTATADTFDEAERALIEGLGK